LKHFSEELTEAEASQKAHDFFRLVCIVYEAPKSSSSTAQKAREPLGSAVSTD